jgi:hypothetical protein
MSKSHWSRISTIGALLASGCGGGDRSYSPVAGGNAGASPVQIGGVSNDAGAASVDGGAQVPAAGNGGATNVGGVPSVGGTTGTATAAGSSGAAVGGNTTNGDSGRGGAGGALPTKQFRGGPCAATPDQSSVEVFARGDDQHIYRRVVTGSDWGNWASLTDLDGSLLDNRSDLDCSAEPTTVHIVASGVNPAGAYLHAFGFGTTYNQFTRELSPAVFTFSPTIGDHTGNLVLGGTNGTYGVASNAGSDLALNVTNPLTSGPDVSAAYDGDQFCNYFYFAAFDDTAHLAMYFFRACSGGASWGTPIFIAPPPGQQYQYSPTVCRASVANAQTGHVFVAAGGSLWYGEVNGSPALGTPPVFTNWESIPNSAVSSAPDCVDLSNGTVHAVALTPTGTVIDVYGTSGNFAVKEFGTY